MGQWGRLSFADNSEKKKATIVRLNIRIPEEARKRFRNFQINRAYKNEGDAFVAMLDLVDIQDKAYGIIDPEKHDY